MEPDGADITDPAEIQSASTRMNFRNVPLFTAAGPTQDDVVQGEIGDCWLMAPLAAIAKTDPDYLRQSIVSLGDGTFAVRVGGGYYRVDADLAMSGGLPTFAGFGNDASGNDISASAAPTSGSLWVAMIEKAAAYSFGGTYEDLDGDFVQHGFGVMGYRAIFDATDDGVDDGNSTLNWIQTQLDAGRAVAFGTEPEILGVSSAVVGQHCYSIDSIITDPVTGTRSIKVRNPWGDDGPVDNGMGDGYIILSGTMVYQSYSKLVAVSL